MSYTTRYWPTRIRYSDSCPTSLRTPGGRGSTAQPIDRTPLNPVLHSRHPFPIPASCMAYTAPLFLSQARLLQHLKLCLGGLGQWHDVPNGFAMCGDSHPLPRLDLTHIGAQSCLQFANSGFAWCYIRLSDGVTIIYTKWSQSATLLTTAGRRLWVWLDLRGFGS